MNQLADPRDTADDPLDLNRFSEASRRLLVAGLAVLLVLGFIAGWPLVWHLLDTSELFGDVAGSGAPPAGVDDLAHTRLYTGAYIVSILAFLMMGALYLVWLRRHAVADRLPTPVVIGLGVLLTLQTSSIAAAWGDQYTGDAIHEALHREGISIWGRDVIERAWYAGYAAQVTTGLLALAVTPLSHTRRWRTFVVAWPVVVVVVWFVLGNPYLGWA